MARGASSNLGTEDWVAAYNAVMARGGPDNSGKKPGPGCCSICCTGFSIFAALFLFILASAMKSHYPYMHVHGASVVARITYPGAEDGPQAKSRLPISAVIQRSHFRCPFLTNLCGTTMIRCPHHCR